MLLGCLLGFCLWLILGALVAWLGWITSVVVLLASLLLLLPWLAPDRPLN